MFEFVKEIAIDSLRPKFRTALIGPTLFILVARLFSPNQFLVLRNFVSSHIPHPTWVYPLFVGIQTFLEIWNFIGYVCLALVLLRVGIQLLLRRKLYYIWRQLALISLGFIVESSFWWWFLYAFRMVYENAVPNFPFRSGVIYAPAIVYGLSFLIDWLIPKDSSRFPV